jgi:hypothetical protein
MPSRLTDKIYRAWIAKANVGSVRIPISNLAPVEKEVKRKYNPSNKNCVFVS